MNFNYPDENKRLAELYSYYILDTEAEKEFDDLTEIASIIAGTPMSAISLIDTDRQWFKAKTGIEKKGGDRENAFCSVAIRQEDYLLVEDALEDQRFVANTWVTEAPNIRFYAGFPLTTERGYKLGTLCVLDSQPRTLTAEQKNMLQKLAVQVMKLIELRVKHEELNILKKEVELQRDQLGHLLDHQRKLMTILAHDTRGPLGSMQTLLNLYNNKQIAPEETAEIFTIFEEQVGILLSLLENITQWGSAYAEKKEEEIFRVDLQALAAEAFALFTKQAADKKIRFVNGLHDHISIDFNKEIISFIIRNLLNNAIKFTHQGTISLHGKQEGKTYRMVLEDTGVGMSSEMARKLFVQRAFSRDGTHQEKGSGLGLLLIKDFIDQVGGSIKVESEENKGTRMIIDVPVQATA